MNRPPYDLRAGHRPPTRRHPAQVTADRLGDAYERYYDQLSSDERDALGLVRQALDEIANGER